MTTIAGVHLNLPRYDRRAVDGLWLGRREVDEAVERLRSMSYAERAANACIGKERADLVLAGCAILEAIRSRFPAERLRIADRGLREGILSQMMRADGVGPRRPGSLAMSGGSGREGGRALKTRVKTARKRSLSSTLWLERQLNDPYVAQARREGYRSRAAYKLLEIAEKYKLFRPGQRIVDLGAAPGRLEPGRRGSDRRATKAGAGWSPSIFWRWIRSRASNSGRWISTPPRRRSGCGNGSAAWPTVSSPTWPPTPPATGRPTTCASWGWSSSPPSSPREVLAPGGFFLAKVLQGGAEGELLAALKREFAAVRHVKPKASRADSAELYLLATGFRGRLARQG